MHGSFLQDGNRVHGHRAPGGPPGGQHRNRREQTSRKKEHPQIEGTHPVEDGSQTRRGRHPEEQTGSDADDGQPEAGPDHQAPYCRLSAAQCDPHTDLARLCATISDMTP